MRSGRVLRGSFHMTRPNENTLAETYQYSVLDEPAYDGRRQPEGGGDLGGTTDTQAPDA